MIKIKTTKLTMVKKPKIPVLIIAHGRNRKDYTNKYM